MTASVFLGWLGLIGGCIAFVGAGSILFSSRQHASPAQQPTTSTQRRTRSTMIVWLLGLGCTQCLSALTRFTDNDTVHLGVSIGYIIVGLGQLAWLRFIVTRVPMTNEAHEGLLFSGRLLLYITTLLGIFSLVAGVIGLAYV